MAASTDFNYDDILSLEKAKLVNRIRLNFLGSKELVLRYNGITSAAREEAVEYLEANRLDITNPSFGFKTYDGIWYCVDITYDEDKKFLQQRFKIDSSLEDTIAQKTPNGATVERSYFWRVVDPDNATILAKIPSSVPNGTIYTKSVIDNGDGTYDVTITKETVANLTASSAVQAGTDDGTDNPGGYREEVDVSTSDTEQAFVSDAGTVPDAIVGEIKRIDNIALENGKFRTTITTRTAIPQRIPPESEAGGPNYPWLEYGSDFITDANNIIIGRNQSWDQVIADRDRTNVSPAIFKINSMSVRVNDFGLYDYTIVSNSPG